MLAFTPGVDGYSDGTFASRTIFQHLNKAREQLGPYHLQMQGDGTGVKALRIINPANDDMSDVIYIPLRGPREFHSESWGVYHPRPRATASLRRMRRT